MVANSISLNFNFNTEIPGRGGPNKYENLAPGNIVINNKAERLKGSLRAERYEVYEKTFKLITDLIGFINFKEYTFEKDEQTIGNILDELVNKIIKIQNRLNDGGFPLSELYTTGIIKSFDNVYESDAIIHLLKNICPGRINFCPEIDIVDITNRTLTLTGGKTLTNKGIVEYLSNSLYIFEIDKPSIAKNVPFDEATGVFEKTSFNKILFKTVGTDFVGQIPLLKNKLGIPYHLPVEPFGMGNNKSYLLITETDIQISLPDTLIESIYDDPDPENFYIRFPVSAIDPSLNSLVVNGELPLYIYYQYIQWRMDYIGGNNIGEIKLFKNDPEEETPKIEDGYQIFYKILVNCWSKNFKDITGSDSWSIRSNILPVNYLEKDKAKYQDNIIDNRTYFNFMKILKDTLFELSEGKIFNKEIILTTKNNKIIQNHEIETEFGKKLIIKNPATLDFSNWKQILNTEYTSFYYPGNILENSNIEEKNFIFTGLSFKLGMYNFITSSWSEVINLSPGVELQYQIFEEDNLVLEGITSHPQNSIPETLIYYNKKISRFKKTNDYYINLKLIGTISSFTAYYLFAENNSDIGNCVLPGIYTGSGYSKVLKYLDNQGTSETFGAAGDLVSFTKRYSLERENFSFSFFYTSNIIGILKFSHDYNPINQETEIYTDGLKKYKWIDVTLELKDKDNPNYPFILKRKIYIDQDISNFLVISSLKAINCTINNGFIAVIGTIESIINQFSNQKIILNFVSLINISDPEIVVSTKFIQSPVDCPSTYQKIQGQSIIDNSYLATISNSGHISLLIQNEDGNISKKTNILSLDHALNVKGFYSVVQNSLLYSNYSLINYIEESGEYANILVYLGSTGLRIEYLKLINGNNKFLSQENNVISQTLKIFSGIVEPVYVKLIEDKIEVLHYIGNLLYMDTIIVENEDFRWIESKEIFINFDKSTTSKFYIDENNVIAVGKIGTILGGMIWNNESVSTFTINSNGNEINLIVNKDRILVKVLDNETDYWIYEIEREDPIDKSKKFPSIKSKYLGNYIEA